MQYEAVVGLEVHAELQTHTKMFCACQVVDSTEAEPNRSVCPICAGMPGMLPLVNGKAVEYGVKVALALQCQVNAASLFARKNYFYPDLPKGYQISQYDEPLARHGKLEIETSAGPRLIRIRRVHLEEDTGKLTHKQGEGNPRSLIDLNRAGVPLLEIVTEPDLHTAEEVRAYAVSLHAILRWLEVNSGDMEKGVFRIEPNISVRPCGSPLLGTRTEVKNLNSFRALERSVDFEIQRQIEVLERGQAIVQETRGWDDSREVTFSQRIKEEAEDYRYFPEPDLPPLVVEAGWVESLRQGLPELPNARKLRFQVDYGLTTYDAEILVTDKLTANYFEAVLAANPGGALSPKTVANWITGDLFALLNAAGINLINCRIPAEALAGLLMMVTAGEINQPTAKTVLAEMFASGKSAEEIVQSGNLRQISDTEKIAELVRITLAGNPDQVASYLAGKETVARWLFGQVMRQAGGKANPTVVQTELDRQLKGLIKN